MISLEDDYLVGLLNSRLAKYYFSSIVSKMRGGYFSMSKVYVETLPIVFDSERLDEMKSLVNRQIKYTSEYGIESMELQKEIDQLVYKLYDLTAEEIEIIENNLST